MAPCVVGGWGSGSGHGEHAAQAGQVEFVVGAQPADHRAKLAQGFAAGRDAEEIFGDPGSPLVEPGGGEGSPTRLEAAVEHVAVAEVLDQKTVGIAPIVEDLAAEDVPADSP